MLRYYVMEFDMTETTAAVSIHLNGKESSLPEGTSIDAFLAGRKLHGKLVVIEINGVIVPRPAFSSRIFEPGDVVEVVHFVGGG